MKKDFILTFITQFIVLASGLIIFRLAIVYFGEIGFSEYSILKRNLSYIYTLTYLGLGIAIPRYIALELGSKSKNIDNTFVAALLLVLLSLLSTGIFFIIFKEQLSFLLFGEKHYTYLILPLYISISGLLLHGCIYSYYRGKMLFKYANMLQMIHLGFIPLIVFLFSTTIEEVFIYTGGIVASTSTLLLINIIYSMQLNRASVTSYIPKLFIYGIQRLPADFSLASLIALPAIFIAHTNDIVAAGYVAFSISLLSLSGQVIAPIGLIMLPKISLLKGEENQHLIQHYTKKLLLFSIVVALIGSLIYQLFAKEILELYLNKTNINLISTSKKIMLGAFFYPIYVTMRSIVDGYYERSYNTVSAMLSLTVFLLYYQISGDIYNSLIIALFVLATATLFFIRPILYKGQD